jgi:energy-coupling factor transporter ATP-binding protein EcfA2
MDEEKLTTPKATLGEGASWVLLALAIGPNPANWGLAPLAGIGALIIWAARRNEDFRGWVETQVEEMEASRTPQAIVTLARNLPVPPAGSRHLLTDSRKARRSPEVIEAVREAQPAAAALRQGFLDLLGEDNPLEAQPPRKPSQSPRRPQVSTQAGRETGANQRLTQDASRDAAAEWVARAVEADRPAIKALSLQDAIEELNTDVDDHPHILLVGNSGAGKTALAQLLIGTRPGKVVILDPKRPKGWEGPKWGGLPYVSRDRDGGYTAMVTALEKVVDEMNDRYHRQETATEPFPQLTVVLDEAKNSLEECPELADQYRLIVSIGREVGVRLVLISTTDRARKLGFDGEADSLDSFTWVRLGEFAVKALPEVAERGTERYYHAVVKRGGGWVAFQNELAYGLVKEHLRLRATKAWDAVLYNCQGVIKPAEPVAAPRQPAVRPTQPREPVRLVSAAREVVVPAPARPAAEPEFDLLGSLLATPVVKTFPREVDGSSAGSARPASVTSSESHFGTSEHQNGQEASFGNETRAVLDPRQELKNRLRELAAEMREIPEVERPRVQKTLHLMASGKSLTAALTEAWGNAGGRHFAVRSGWVRKSQEARALLTQLKS